MVVGLILLKLDNGCLPQVGIPPIKVELIKEVKAAATSAERHNWFHNPRTQRTREMIMAAGMYEKEQCRKFPTSYKLVISGNMAQEKLKYQNLLENNPKATPAPKINELDQCESRKL